MSEATLALSAGLVALKTQLGRSFSWNDRPFTALSITPTARDGPGGRGLAFGQEFSTALVCTTTDFPTMPRPGEFVTDEAGQSYPITGVECAPGAHIFRLLLRQPRTA